MDTFCSYHPTKPAAWDCEKCDILLCDECVVTKKDKQFGVDKEFHLCPKCNQEVQWLGISHILKPFWERLPRFFIYPFSIRPLILNIILSFCMLFFYEKTLFSGLCRFALWGVWLKYSFAALQKTARGNLNPPGISTRTISDNFEDVFKQLAIYFILLVSFGLITGVFGRFIGYTYGIVVLLCLPSMIILLVSTQSLFQALNPSIFTRLPFRIGGGYLVMYLFLIALGTGPAVILGIFARFLPPVLLGFIIPFFQNYYTLISYNLMGYVLLQYHEEIGYDIDYEDYVKEAASEKPGSGPAASPSANEMDIYLKEGNFDKAIDIARTEINLNNSTDLSIHERYHNLLKLKNMTSDMVSHGTRYLDLLIKSNAPEDACGVFLACTGADEEFVPDAKALLRVAGWLKKSGQFREAVKAYHTFTRKYPKDPMIPMAYFRAAEIFNEALGQKTKAHKMLTGLVKKYPDHDIIPFVKNYQKKLAV